MMKQFLFLAATHLLALSSQPTLVFGDDVVVQDIKTFAPPTIVDNGPPKMVRVELHGVAKDDGTVESEWKALDVTHKKRPVELTNGEIGNQTVAKGNDYIVRFSVPIVAVNGTLFFIQDTNNDQRDLSTFNVPSSWYKNLSPLDCLEVIISQIFFSKRVYRPGVKPPAIETVVNNIGDKIYNITVIVNKGGGGSEPHFKTWSGKKFDYHGECDLVLFSDNKFHNGVGLDVHIRTTIVNDYSYISNAAVRIGSDVLEVTSDGTFFLNYGEEAEVPTDVGGFPIEYTSSMDGNIEYNIRLGGEEVVTLRAYKGFMWATVSLARKQDLIGHASGLMGSYPLGQFVGRNNSTVFEDPVEFSEDWQVRDTEAVLFHEIREPQYPSKCIPPPNPAVASRYRKLRGSDFAQKAAEACEKWGDDKEECIFDVLATGDLEMANIGGLL